MTSLTYAVNIHIHFQYYFFIFTPETDVKPSSEKQGPNYF